MTSRQIQALFPLRLKINAFDFVEFTGGCVFRDVKDRATVRITGTDI
jgi:hypothetical protein